MDAQFIVRRQDPEEIFVAKDVLPRSIRPLSARQIIEGDWPKVRWIIPSLLRTGANYLTGRPKAGKSCLAVQYSGAVQSEGELFGRQAIGGRVLHFALEDTRDSLKTMLLAQGWNSNENVEFYTVEDLPNAVTVLKHLEEVIKAERYLLFVLDSLAKLCQLDPNAVKENADVFNNLHAIAARTNSGILIVDWMKKTGPKEDRFETGDVIEDSMGATVKVGTVDLVAGLYRKGRKSPQGRLQITGRVPEVEIKILYDKPTISWKMVEWDSDIEALCDTLTPGQRELVEAVRELRPVKALPIAEHVGRQLSNVSKDLKQLVGWEVLTVSGAREYDLPSITTTSEANPTTTTTSITTTSDTSSPSTTASEPPSSGGGGSSTPVNLETETPKRKPRNRGMCQYL